VPSNFTSRILEGSGAYRGLVERRMGFGCPSHRRGGGGWGIHLRDGYTTKHSRYEPSRLQVCFRYDLGRGSEADAG
jgi:hypothetical protein